MTKRITLTMPTVTERDLKPDNPIDRAWDLLQNERPRSPERVALERLLGKDAFRVAQDSGGSMADTAAVERVQRFIAEQLLSAAESGDSYPDPEF